MKPRKLLEIAPLALVLAAGLLLVLGPGSARASDKESNPSDDRGSTGATVEERVESEMEEAEDRGYLGVQVQDLTRSLRRAKNLSGTYGALVNRVEEDSPADKAGIEKGDVILEVNRVSIEDAGELTRTVRDLKPGSRASVTVHRDGNRKSLTVVVGTRPKGLEETPRVFSWRDGDRGPRGFRWDSDAMPPMPREFMMRHHEDLERELDQIRERLEELRDEMRALREDLREQGLPEPRRDRRQDD